jgi:hypothetical protein
MANSNFVIFEPDICCVRMTDSDFIISEPDIFDEASLNDEFDILT